MNRKIVIEASDEGGFTVYVPGLPGCISEGNTRKEALANIKEAIELYLEPVVDDMTLSPGNSMKPGPFTPTISQRTTAGRSSWTAWTFSSATK